MKVSYMKKFTTDEIYHRVFKDSPGEPFRSPNSDATGVYKPGSVIDIVKVIDENGEEGTLTIVCPNIPSGVVKVGVAYEPAVRLLRYPDNTYHFAFAYGPDDPYYEGTGVRDMAIVPVKIDDPRAEEIEKILTKYSLFWYCGNVYPLEYEQEIFKKLDSGEFADIGSLTYEQGHRGPEPKFVLHPDIIVFDPALDDETLKYLMGQ